MVVVRGQDNRHATGRCRLLVEGHPAIYGAAVEGNEAHFPGFSKVQGPTEKARLAFRAGDFGWGVK